MLSLVEVGILLSVNRFIRLPLNPIISWLYSKMSIRTGLFISLAIAGITTLFGWAQGFVFWLILRCIWGIAWSILRLGAYYTIVEVSTNDNRGQNMGSFNGLSRIGGLVGMLGGGFFIEWFGIRNVTLVFGLLALVALPLILRIPKAESQESKNGNSLNSLTTLIKNPLLLKLLLTVFLVMLCLEGMISATLSHLIDVRGVTIDIKGVILSAAILASLIQASRLIIGVFISPWIGKKSDGEWGRRRILIVGLLLATLFVVLTQLNIPDYLWLINLKATLLTTSILIVLLNSFASDLAEERLKAATITLYVIISDIGAAFGPVLGYLSEQAFGLVTTYLISAAILLVLSLQWILLNVTKKSISRS
ncbi:MFS transporter [Paenibacillus chitinolyticus]|uniref:MFS transporter n=1 Tax=Paenibacillus chitinolyticus TaxID=79263 RepID=A0ABT4FI29_9BACL|nr:MFS transporter [Paenibacillus chitinolyticus]MCY9589857.1 MFS transporter [Paenibacillus chitinolyticus]MCY9598142.1 MFS transporter [Paenibacillus chitinolyticus]